MSPEQAEGKPLDARSDIFRWARCSTSWPRDSVRFLAIRARRYLPPCSKEDPPPVEQVRADVPAELGRLIMGCLRKDASRRCS